MFQTTIATALVGARFRPPAKQVLAHLPAGAALRLRPEPENPYDAKAIQVLCTPHEVIPAGRCPELSLDLDGTGWTLHELMDLAELQLGYIVDSDGAICRKTGGPGNREVGQLLAAGPPARVTLGFDVNGHPQVVVTGATEPTADFSDVTREINAAEENKFQ